MEPDRYTAVDLLEFVRGRMAMSSYYQPLVIRSLVEAGGRLSSNELAKMLLLEDRFALSRALRVLMRWPRLTLQKHGIVSYDRRARTFELQVEVANSDEQNAIIAECTRAIERWQQTEAPKVASRFFGVIEAAGGRCEACGVPGSIRPIDVDHVVPRSRAHRGNVTLEDGTRVPVDDRRNLQALCSRCNRGKRDTSTYDFRPTADRLAETIALVLEKALESGLDAQDLLADAEARVRRSSVQSGSGQRRR